MHIDSENVFLYNVFSEKTFSQYSPIKAMSIKLEDIAKETGFSISTVSRVLSNSSCRF
jgi:DNA-directed RNA polymerase specialized sigma54-like protein